jgi:hypothetical protein
VFDWNLYLVWIKEGPHQDTHTVFETFFHTWINELWFSNNLSKSISNILGKLVTLTFMTLWLFQTQRIKLSGQKSKQNLASRYLAQESKLFTSCHQAVRSLHNKLTQHSQNFYTNGDSSLLIYNTLSLEEWFLAFYRHSDPFHTAWHPRKPELSTTPLQKPQILFLNITLLL